MTGRRLNCQEGCICLDAKIAKKVGRNHCSKEMINMDGTCWHISKMLMERTPKKRKISVDTPSSQRGIRDMLSTSSESDAAQCKGYAALKDKVCLAVYACSSLAPFTSIAGRSHDIAKMLAMMGFKSITYPTREEITRFLLPAMRRFFIEKAKKELQGRPIAVTVDGWSCKSTHNV
jgi:hypothetical protein